MFILTESAKKVVSDNNDTEMAPQLVIVKLTHQVATAFVRGTTEEKAVADNYRRHWCGVILAAPVAHHGLVMAWRGKKIIHSMTSTPLNSAEAPGACIAGAPG